MVLLFITKALSTLPTRFLRFSLLASVHTKHLFQFLKDLYLNQWRKVF